MASYHPGSPDAARYAAQTADRDAEALRVNLILALAVADLRALPGSSAMQSDAIRGVTDLMIQTDRARGPVLPEITHAWGVPR